jgi:hypothetical protein
MQSDEGGQDAPQGFAPMATSAICSKAISDTKSHRFEDSRTINLDGASDGHLT